MRGAALGSYIGYLVLRCVATCLLHDSAVFNGLASYLQIGVEIINVVPVK